VVNTVKYPEFATKNSALLKGTTNMQKLTVEIQQKMSLKV
jgi:hypothetical protein